MHEYQKKRLTKWVLRKCVILKDMFLVVWEEQEPGNWYRWEEKRERAPALQMQFSILLIIAPGKGKSENFGRGSVPGNGCVYRPSGLVLSGP